MASIPLDNTPMTESHLNQTSHSSTKIRYIIVGVFIFVVIVVVISLVVYFTVGGAEPETSQSGQQYTYLAGNSIRLPCLVSNQDTDTIWYFDGQPVVIGDRFAMSEKSLSIRNLQGNDGGEYVCKSGQIKVHTIKLAVVEVILDNVTSSVGEGPHWEHETQSLLFVDHYTRELHRWNSITRKHEIEILPGNVGFVVPYKNGGYIVSIGRKLIHFNWETKQVKTLHEVDHGTFNAFNDGKVDPKGRVWAGTFANFTDLEDPVYFYKGSMYMMDLDGRIHKKWENITMTNGFSWTRDNKTMYYVDSIPGKVYRFDYNVDTGNIKYQGVAIDFKERNKDINTLGYPDGMTMDREGMLWIACYEAARIVRFNPVTGEILRIIDFKGLATRTTSCCFGGPNYDVLYVTSAAAQSEEELKRDLYPGSVFRVTGLGVRGYPGRAYQGVL